MSWFDILKEIEMDESALHAQEFAEENCCANIWKSIAQEQHDVFNFLRQSSLWDNRKTTEGCRRLVEWLREGSKSRMNSAQWHFPAMGNHPIREADFQDWMKQIKPHIYNQKKGWLQDYVDCRNLKDGGNRPQLRMLQEIYAP